MRVTARAGVGARGNAPMHGTATGQQQYTRTLWGPRGLLRQPWMLLALPVLLAVPASAEVALAERASVAQGRPLRPATSLLRVTSKSGVGGGSAARTRLARGGGLRVLQHQPRSPDFFTEDAEKMDLLPNTPPIIDRATVKQPCHPKCTWDCGLPKCNAHCRPVCQPPKCVTTCRKLLSSRCKSTCPEPQCVVLCPPHPPESPQCEQGRCSQCETVCNKPHCSMDCGSRSCESSCDDPVCAWSCSPDPCPEPQCRMVCEKPSCSDTFAMPTREPTLREVYAGRDGRLQNAQPVDDGTLTAVGLAKVGAGNLTVLRPAQPLSIQPMGGSQPAVGAQPMGGARSPMEAPPVPCDGCQIVESGMVGPAR